jgi:hypothetical protein
MDAWFDVTISLAGADCYLAGADGYEALLFAFVAEMPLAVLPTGTSALTPRRW